MDDRQSRQQHWHGDAGRDQPERRPVGGLAMPVCRCQTPRIEVPRLFRVILPVSDIEVAASFYAHLLETEGTRVSTGRHYFDCAGTILVCYDAVTDGDPERVGPNPQHVYFSVDDLDAAHARAEHAECRELTSIEIRPWGERSFYARDPFDNPICFVDSQTLFTAESSWAGMHRPPDQN
jgi:uncharacterized glyoxalase superfamily protein PhnB